MFYDPGIVRWNVTNQLAENHYDLNPYHYVMGNPMIYIDPFGLDTAKVYRKLQEQDAIARERAEAMRNRAKLQSLKIYLRLIIWDQTIQNFKIKIVTILHPFLILII